MRSISRLVALGFAAVAFGAVGYAQEPSRVYQPGDGVTMPVIVREVRPEYTSEARKARIQGTVTLDVVVVEDGTVGEVKVTRSLDEEYGLDEQAVKAMKQWSFKPGTKDGKPVAVRVDVQMSFTLK
jgi:periplasmic protein TonB